jgi:hypothetical protein
MAHVETVSATTDINSIIEIINRDGCIVIEGLLDKNEISEIQKFMNDTFEKTANCNGNFYGHSTKRLGKLFSRHKIFQKMAVLNPIIEVMDHFLLGACSDYQINLTQAISIGPGEVKQILHQDDPMFPFVHPNSETMINCMWAIDDFTEDNGATVLVPGSHLWPRTKTINLSFENLPSEMFTKGVMKKGSVLIYLGSLYHCGGANNSNSSRCGSVISYNLGWLRQAENSYLAYSPEEVKEMPERLQRLLGYFVHEPNLGSVDGIDPYDYAILGKKEKEFTEFIPKVFEPILEDHVKRQKSMVG